MTILVEEWRPVPGYPNYEVSNTGRIRSIDHIDNIGRFRKGKELKQVSDGKGNYLYVTLCRQGMNRRESIHRIVAFAFIPNPDGYNEINHKDEDKKNNVASNLEWCTRSYNNAYNGRICGAKNPQNKISESDARYIREHPQESTTELSRRFGISLPQVSAIKHGKRWCWL